MLSLVSSLIVGAAGPAPAPVNPWGGPLFWMVVPIVVLGYFLLFRPESQQRKQRQRMIDQLKKNDRVMTIGGIFGVVSNVKPGDNEVVIKVDDNTGTKLRVARTHIAQVIEVAEGQESARSTP